MFRRLPPLISFFQSLITQNILPCQEETDAKSRKLPSHLLEVKEGFPRLAVVTAFYLHKHFDKTEEESKELARSMVETWISCGFEYKSLRRVCLGDERIASKKVKLHEVLVEKSSTDLSMFQVSAMVDLTIRYFYRALKANDSLL